jgi:hypothetical protein
MCEAISTGSAGPLAGLFAVLAATGIAWPVIAQARRRAARSWPWPYRGGRRPVAYLAGSVPALAATSSRAAHRRMHAALTLALAPGGVAR